jgi:predicted Zn-dependent protease
MKTKTMLVVALLAFTTPAYAQFGGLLDKVQRVADAKKKIGDLIFSEEEERTIGSQVSEKVRQRFGVVQDPAIHKYVTLVGTLVTQASDRPALGWRFIVLDTDGVNAFAAPGGFVHITRGALALIDTESELASVIGHEVAHVTEKHTINAIQKNSAQSLATDMTIANRSALLGRVANLAYDQVLEGSFDRDDEIEADKVSTELASKAGYAPTLGAFLARLAERNRDQPARNGLFASHPETTERVQRLERLAEDADATRLGSARYALNVSYEPTPLTEIAVVVEGASGLAEGDKAEEPEKKEEEAPKRRGFGLVALARPSSSNEREKESAQVQASGGSRGVGPDRLARGGDNPTPVEVTVTPAEVTAFKNGIV